MICLLFIYVLTSSSVSLALLLLRLIVGVAFLYHGWGKIQNTFAWMPAGSPIPGFLQFLAALSEFGGGAALILGLFTPLASLGLGLTMLVATYFHAIVMNDPFVNLTGDGSFEPALGYLGISVLFMALGPGKISLDALLFRIKD